MQREYANILQRRFTFNVLIAPKTSIFQYPGPTKRCSTNALLGFIIRSLVLKLMLKAGIQRERDIYIYIMSAIREGRSINDIIQTMLIYSLFNKIHFFFFVSSR